MDEIAPVTETEGIEGTLFDPDWWEVRGRHLEELGRPALWYWEDWTGWYENELKWRIEIEPQIKANMDPWARKALGWE
jgi:hypothetical protein